MKPTTLRVGWRSITSIRGARIVSDISTRPYAGAEEALAAFGDAAEKLYEAAEAI